MLARTISARLLLTVLCTGALAAGCGSSSNKSSSADLCSNINSLQTSVQDLKNVNVVQNGTSALQSALDKVRTDADATATAAKSEFKPQVDALRSSLDSLKTAIQNIRSNGVAPVQDAAQSVQTSFTNLQNAAKSKNC